MSIMKNKKIMILIIMIIIGIIVVVKFASSNITTKTNKNISRYYDLPLISLVTEDYRKAAVSAGYYRYGDIIIDGIIDQYDVGILKDYLNNNIKLDEKSIILADINGDGKVTKTDLDILTKFYDNSGVLTYDVKNSDLLYCLSKTKTSKKCKWQDNNIFEMKDDGTYYIYVKDKKTDKISSVQKYKYKYVEYNN